MRHLREVISALRQEILEGLADPGSAAFAARFSTHRVTVSLRFAIRSKLGEDGRVSFGFPVADLLPGVETAGDPAVTEPCHTVTFEFAPLGSRNDSAPRESSSLDHTAAASPPSQTGAETDAVASELAAVLGKPGFDSAARAMVFREVASDLSDAEMRAILHSLQEVPVPLGESHARLKQARHKMGGVLRTGPMKPASQGASVLLRVLGRTSLQSIVRLIEERWKSQEFWLETPNWQGGSRP